MVETTVKQRAFAFIVFDFQNLDTRLRKHKAYDVTHHARAAIPPDCDPLAEKLAR